MRIMICGSKGQIGSDCVRVFQTGNQLGFYDKPEFDIIDASQVDRQITGFSPDVVINCAAFTKVDECESSRELAWHVNALAPGHLAKSCSATGSVLVHLSTDYVFDGLKELPEPYGETDEANPVSIYGKSKLEAEIQVASTSDHYIILRTAWVYGINGHNFLKTMLRLALANPDQPINVVNDQFGSPTWSHDLALQIKMLIKKKGLGIYHATSEGSCSWYELAIYFLKKMNVSHGIVPCSSKIYPQSAKRPKNSILDNRRLKREGFNLMPDWKLGVDRFVARYGEQLLDFPE